jgi:ribonucleotide monophosphatase NagD (HAD superfamily)
LTRHFVADHPGRKVVWLGPERDNSIYRGLDPVLAPLEQADYIVCTGLFDDETESAEDYRAMMLQARERKLPLICANPDIVVERGDRLIYCAGAIAELYRELGGEVTFYGKPHRPIYERAMTLAAERRGHATGLSRVLAIGDSVRTDLAGAHGFGIDCLFVTRGIHVLKHSRYQRRGCPGHLARRRASRFCPGMTNFDTYRLGYLSLGKTRTRLRSSPCPETPPRSWSSAWRR